MNPQIPPAGQPNPYPYPVPPYPQPPHPHMVPVHYYPVQQFPSPQAIPAPPPAPFDFKEDDDDDDRRGRRAYASGNGAALIWVILLMVIGVSMFFGGYIFLVGQSATADGSRGVVAGISLITTAVLCGLGLIYFIPTFVAVVRGHPQVLPIFIINFFLGAFLLGFVGALVWACMYIEPPARRRYR